MNMTETTRIYCKNISTFVDVPVGRKLSEIYDSLNISLPHLCVGAIVNNRAEGLDYRVYKPKDIEFIDISTSSGMRIYVRSLCFVLYMAVDEILPGSRLRIEHPISNGYYCQINHRQHITDEQIGKILERMRRIVADDMPFRRVECHTCDLVKLFNERKLSDKVDLLETSGMLYSNFYRLNHHIDFYYGALLPSTGPLRVFNLQRYDDGMILVIPRRSVPEELEQVRLQPKLMNIFKEFSHFNFIAGISTVGKVNKVIDRGEAGELLKVSEALQEKKIASIADEISQRKETRIVLISGPSSSGKTTFSKRLSVQLMTNLIRPVSISLDDYFVDRHHTPLDDKGEYDYESLYALDLETFNRDLNDLIEGREVEIPTFNFQTGLREYSGKRLKLHPTSKLLIEGIHALNPALTAHIEERFKYRVYVSALTTISIDDHNWIPTTDNRLLRRIVRDFRFRGYSALDTISRWESVRAGENKWIFPYQENADAMFNSALVYELAVLKTHAQPILEAVPKSAPEYAEAYRLLRFLDYFRPVYESEIPPTSLLREFLGGSSFIY